MDRDINTRLGEVEGVFTLDGVVLKMENKSLKMYTFNLILI